MIVDCFTFYNEVDFIIKRMTYLNPVVDKFVIVESTYTHRGEPKELYFQMNKDKFDAWKDKIIHIILDVSPPDSNPWTMENLQRNYILNGIETIPDDAIIMISDADEVPKVELIRKLPNSLDTISLHMITFNYSIEYFQTFEKWFGTVISTKKNVVDKTPQYFRDNRWKFPHVELGGWHFTSFGDIDFVSNKIHNFSHCNDDDVDENMTETYMKEKLSHNGKFKLTPSPPELIESLPDIFK
jgi:beta-1,4-mannosyl-glycoprotein beta-1,4-N-acetylglucosaminyltransferase